MRYKCLVVDHDDTIVNSTATIHFPSFMLYMKEKRPEIRMTLDEYFALNFDPGVVALFRDICGLSEEEFKEEEAFWAAYTAQHIPEAYPGIKEILWEFKKQGGIICVDSHSFSKYIRRDYEHNGLPEPDLIYGWDLEPEKRKPAPWTLFEIEKKFGLKPEEMLVLDDLKPGYDMAKDAGVPFAAAGWANDVPQIETFMRKNCDLYFKTVQEFGEYLLG